MTLYYTNVAKSVADPHNFFVQIRVRFVKVKGFFKIFYKRLFLNNVKSTRNEFFETTKITSLRCKGSYCVHFLNSFFFFSFSFQKAGAAGPGAHQNFYPKPELHKNDASPQRC
jgi:hypothetical protein